MLSPQKLNLVSCSKLVSLLVVLLCVTGFSFQVYQICIQYLSYATVTKTKIGIGPSLPTPSLVVCPKVSDVLNRTNANQYGILSKRPESVEGYKNEYGKLTIREIFNLTLPTSDVLSQCIHRVDDDLYGVDEIQDKKRCYELFDVKKYFMQENICYDFTPKKLKSYPPYLYAYAPMYAWLIYSVYLGNSFDNAQSILFILYTLGMNETFSLPFDSRFYGVVWDWHKGTEERKSFAFHLRHQLIFTKKLKPPYGNCHEHDSKSRCIRRCLIDRHQQIRRVPNSEIITEPVDLRPPSFDELKNASVRQRIVAFRNECIAHCSWDACEYNFAITLLRVYRDKSNSGLSWINVVIPDRHCMSVESAAQVNLYEFLIYICSSFGIWFGLSFMSLQPSSLKKLPGRRPSSSTKHKCFYQHHYCRSIYAHE